jgi:4-amino-4-deoxy-L-arabinose transferase-like glycosyltransferase
MAERLRDYLVLVVVTAVVTLPGLGRVSLWDVDEGVNAQAAREMLEADTWIVPTFNYALRTAKPVLLYWLQRLSYTLWGISEWSARWPSVCCALVAVLLCYELGRRLWERWTGLWSGGLLATAVQFVVLARAATPDAPLLLFTVLTYYTMWRGLEHSSSRWWLVTGSACGLAVLTKGPIGVVLPGAVGLLYVIWQRQWRLLGNPRLLHAALLFVLVAGPWYALVANETRGQWVKAFLARENLERFMRPMEGHSGLPIYYLLVLPLMWAPWSIWLWPTLEHALIRSGLWRWRRLSVTASVEPADPVAAPYRFLLCWITVYLLVFSLAATKLPNYIFPLYPALALLTARLLVLWQRNQVLLAGWVVPLALGLLGVGGVGVTIGLLWAPTQVTGLQPWSLLGVVLLAAALLAARAWRRQQRQRMLGQLGLTAVLFAALTAANLPVVLDRHRAPRPLVQASGVADPQRDLRLATYRWFAPSLVFYSGRQVLVLQDTAAVQQFLQIPTPGYLFVPLQVWQQEAAHWGPSTCLAHHADLLARQPIAVIANPAAFAEMTGQLPAPVLPQPAAFAEMTGQLPAPVPPQPDTGGHRPVLSLR